MILARKKNIVYVYRLVLVYVCVCVARLVTQDFKVHLISLITTILCFRDDLLLQ